MFSVTYDLKTSHIQALFYIAGKGKGKAFPLQALDKLLGFQEVEAPRISRQSTLEGGKVVSPMHRLSLPPGRIHGTHFC